MDAVSSVHTSKQTRQTSLGVLILKGKSFVKPFVSSCAFLGQTNAEFHCSVLAPEHRGLQYRL